MDISLYYKEEGKGEPLILLHGNGENSEYFEHQIRHFSQRYRTIAIDTRGHGRSSRGEAPFTIRQFAEDLHDFMEEHAIMQANILGFSDGGNVALVFALKYPERVKRLILNGANLFGSGVKAHVQIPIIIGYKLASAFAKKSLQAQKNAELLGLMVNDPAIEAQALKKLTIPTLVITGTKDLIKDSHTRLICESLPNAQWKRIKGDHFVANRNPAAFNQAVEEFLSEE